MQSRSRNLYLRGVREGEEGGRERERERKKKREREERRKREGRGSW